MTKIFTSLTLASMILAGATGLSAQTTTDTQAPAASDLAMGQDPNAISLPDQATAQVGQTYLAAQFDAWQQHCRKTEDGKDPCELYQLLKDGDGNSVAEISLFSLKEAGQAVAGATFMAPLETLLTAQLRITVDDGQTRIYPFAFCTVKGCVARIGFTAEEIDSFKKGAKAMVTIVPAAAPDRNVNLDLSLKGFTAAYDAISGAAAQ